MKKILLCVLVFTLLISSFGVYAETTYHINPMFTDAKYDTYVKDSLVMRVGNNFGFYDRIKTNMDTHYYRIVPYVHDGVVYIPIGYTLDMFGYTSTEGKYSISFNIDGKEYNAAHGETPEGFAYPVRYSEHCCYAAASDMAKLMGKNLYDNGTLIIISPNDISNPNKSIIAELEAALEWRVGRINIGDEGFVAGYIIHPLDSNIRYTRTDVGGMYRWQPESNTWKQLLMVLPPEDQNLLGIAGFCVDPNDTEIIYAFCGMFADQTSHDILKSYDRGETWTRLGFNKVAGGNNGQTRATGERIAVDPNNSNRIFVGTQYDGLWYSEDAGETWRKSQSVTKWKDGFGINVVWFDSRYVDDEGNTSVIYISNWDDGLYKSEDSGRTFSKVEGSPKMIRRMQFLDDYLYMCSDTYTVDEMSLCKYKDGVFTDISPKPYYDTNQPYYGTGAFIVDYTNPNFIFAMGPNNTSNGDVVYRSWDGGKTWEWSKVGHFAHGCSILVQDPDDPKIVWDANGTGMCIFTDIYGELVNGSLHYEPSQYGMEEMVVLKSLSVPHEDAPLLQFGDYDRRWSFVEDLYQLSIKAHDGHGSGIGRVNSMDFCLEDPKFVVRTGRESDTTGMVGFSDQYGRFARKCEYWINTDTAMACALSANVRDNGYPLTMVATTSMNGVPGSIYRSYDWGTTWEKLDGVQVTASSAWYTNYTNYVMDNDEVDGKTFYFCNAKKFFVTRDDGDTWQMTKEFPNNVEVFAVPGKEGNVYAMSNGVMYKSYDRGTTWEIVKTISSVSSISFGKGKPGTPDPALYAKGTVDNVTGVFISDDMGATWRRIDDDSMNYITYGRGGKLTGDRKTYGRVFVPTGGTGIVYYQLAGLDDNDPLITVDTQSTSDTDPLTYAVADATLKISGRIDERAELRINNNPVELTLDNEFEYTASLAEGINNFRIEAVDLKKNKADPVYLTIRHDPKYMGIALDCKETVLTNQSSITISGETSEAAKITVNGIETVTDEKNKFSVICPITADSNEITVTATSLDNMRTASKKVQVTYDHTLPAAEFTNLPTEPYNKRVYILHGKVSEKGDVRVNDKDITVKDDLTFTTFVTLDSRETNVKLQAKDAAGNVSEPKYVTLLRDMENSFDKSKLDLKYRSDNLVYDGDISEWTFDYELDETYQGNVNNLAQVGMMWDEEYLYVAFKVTDDYIYTENNVNYNNDCIEVYVDGDNHKGTSYNTHDLQYILIAGQKNRVAISTLTDDGYISEWKIPWSDLGVTVKEGSKVGIDIDCIDNDGPSTSNERDGIQGFNGSMENYHNPSLFTTFTLVK